ncbi:MAG: pyruvate kinase [Calditrichaceae bacterium]|nr:pyruvate kinase [Calditrichaceae bacterium]HES60002.1 pyruvate kinase [Caldithrix sp.]
MRNAKIICTIGPACDSEEMLTKLAEAGMNVARLNFSHGSHEEHLQKMKLIRKVSKKLNKPIAILQDLQGPKIRIGKFAEPPISLNPGDLFTITTDEKTVGNENIVSTSYKNLANDVEFGDNILVNDGLIKLKVLEKTKVDIFCEVINGGSLYDRRGINLPGVKISEPSLTKKDKKDLEFGLANGIDYVALSFVREADSIRDIKKFMGKNRVPVIAKLEKPEALNNLDEIIAEADGVMVARGDLGVEIFSARVPVVQKEIIEKCIQAGKPVITATQMLDSMMTNPIPTRAETSDVANAVFDGSDAVMLSGETAFGKFPVESVTMMKSIICEAEQKPTYFRLKPVERCHKENHEFAHSICYAAYYASDETDAKYIVVFTRSGFTAAVMSVLRPEVPVLALTPSEITMRKLTLYWGVTPIFLDKMLDVEDDMTQLEIYLKKNKWVKSGDNIVVISGSSREAGGTNSLRLHAIGK